MNPPKSFTSAILSCVKRLNVFSLKKFRKLKSVISFLNASGAVAYQGSIKMISRALKIIAKISRIVRFAPGVAK